MNLREKIQFCHIKCKNTAVSEVHRTTKKAENYLEEQVTKDSRTSNKFASPYWAKSLSENLRAFWMTRPEKESPVYGAASGCLVTSGRGCHGKEHILG